MSRMLKFHSSLAAVNDNAAGAHQPAFVNRALKGMLTLAIASVVSASALAATPVATKAASTPAPVVAKVAQKDPLAGDTWHAVNSTWPGTIVFDGAKKTVTLTPVGATPMEASYTYTVKPSSTDKVVEGTLRMTNTAKQVSESTFRLADGKELTLTFAGGPRPEQYVRMTPKEEEAEKARLQKMISEGRIRPLKQ
ncbi:hypothetical protein [Burkholderia ubonensis]|uniref:hypothetical protein n=1 Tax=Burkholderia ubonensis TaxID=101571 RepID=UPI0018E03989|nr:hypothetical protein [Burkholderia ubonensis]